MLAQPRLAPLMDTALRPLALTSETVYTQSWEILLAEPSELGQPLAPLAGASGKPLSSQPSSTSDGDVMTNAMTT